MLYPILNFMISVLNRCCLRFSWSPVFGVFEHWKLVNLVEPRPVLSELLSRFLHCDRSFRSTFCGSNGVRGKRRAIWIGAWKQDHIEEGDDAGPVWSPNFGRLLIRANSIAQFLTTFNRASCWAHPWVMTHNFCLNGPAWRFPESLNRIRTASSLDLFWGWNHYVQWELSFKWRSSAWQTFSLKRRIFHSISYDSLLSESFSLDKDSVGKVHES